MTEQHEKAGGRQLLNGSKQAKHKQIEENLNKIQIKLKKKKKKRNAHNLIRPNAKLGHKVLERTIRNHSAVLLLLNNAGSKMKTAAID